MCIAQRYKSNLSVKAYAQITTSGKRLTAKTPRITSRLTGQPTANMYHPPIADPSTLSYAPTPYTYAYTPTTPHLNPDEEVKPYTTSTERDLLDQLAELYSIIRTLDSLEKAFQKDALPAHEYEGLARKMIQQYTSILSDDGVEREFGGLEAFMRAWGIECPRAAETLRAGLPRTEVLRVPQGQQSQQSNHHHHQQQQQSIQQGLQQQQSQSLQQHTVPLAGASGALILTATENFITFLDALKLKLTTKSALHPLLAEVIQSVNKVTDKDFEYRGKIISWLIRLNQMRANEELGDDEVDELAWDMERAYNGFKGIIT